MRANLICIWWLYIFKKILLFACYCIWIFFLCVIQHEMFIFRMCTYCTVIILSTNVIQFYCVSTVWWLSLCPICYFTKSIWHFPQTVQNRTWNTFDFWFVFQQMVSRKRGKIKVDCQHQDAIFIIWDFLPCCQKDNELKKNARTFFCLVMKTKCKMLHLNK